MAAKSAVGIQMCLTKEASASSSNDLSPTAIAAVSGDVPGVTVTCPVGSVQLGDLITFPQDIGFASIAGKTYPVTKLNGTSGFEIGNVVLGSGTMKAGSKLGHFLATDMQCLCLSEFSVTVPTPTTIDVSTYCGAATLASAKSEAGSAAAAGYLDKDDLGYRQILQAAKDGIPRVLRITLGGDNGYFVIPVTVTGLGYTFPLDGAQGYQFTFSFGTTPSHIW